MFDFLKGGKANLQVTLDRIPASYMPGETIHAKVVVEGVKDLKIQSAQIALVSIEEYKARTRRRTTDSDGDTDYEDSTSTHTDEKKEWQKQFLGDTTIKGGTNVSFDFAIPIPGEASPTVDGGKILNLRWVVKTTLDRKLAGDVEDKRDINLLTKPTGSMGGAGDYGVTNEPSEAEMTLALPSKEFVAGDLIKGELKLRPQKEFDTSEIRVELERREDVPEDRGNKLSEKIGTKLAGGTKLKPGAELVLPFQLQIPSGAAITCETAHGSIQWFILGVLSRRMRGDTQVEQEVFIYSAKPDV